MLESIKEIKRQLVTTYKVKPIGGTKEDPLLEIPDGNYLVIVGGKKANVVIKNNTIHNVENTTLDFNVVVNTVAEVLDIHPDPINNRDSVIEFSMNEVENVVLKVIENTWVKKEDSLPDNEIAVFVKKDGKIFNEAIFRDGDNWILWNGHKLTELFVKQITHWKYQHLM